MKDKSFVGRDMERSLDQDCGQHFIKVWDFMLSRLKLRKTELIVYAVIFAIYRNYCESYTGSREYLQKWANASKRTVERALQSLEEKGFIKSEMRTYGRIKRVVYIVNTEALPTCEMFSLENRYRDNMRRIREANKKAANN